MNWIDIVLIVFIILHAISGFRNGFIMEVASLAALILGVILGLYFINPVGRLLVSLFDVEDQYVPVLSFAVIFIAVVLIVILLGKLAGKLVDLTPLGIANKLGGAAFGILKGLFIFSVLLLIVVHFKPTWISQEKRDGSLFYRYVEKIGPLILDNVENFDLGPGRVKEGTSGAPDSDSI